MPDEAVHSVASTPIASSAWLRWASTWLDGRLHRVAHHLRCIAQHAVDQGGRVAGLPDEAGGRGHQDQQRKHGQQPRERQASGLVGALVHDVVADGQHQHAHTWRGHHGGTDAPPGIANPAHPHATASIASAWPCDALSWRGAASLLVGDIGSQSWEFESTSLLVCGALNKVCAYAANLALPVPSMHRAGPTDHDATRFPRRPPLPSRSGHRHRQTVVVIPIASVAPLDGPPDGERVNAFTLVPKKKSYRLTAESALDEVRSRATAKPFTYLAAAFSFG